MDMKGARYKLDDLVFTCDNKIMVVVDVQFVGSLYNEMNFDEDNPVNYDYLLSEGEEEEHWYSHDQIDHKDSETIARIEGEMNERRSHQHVGL